MEEGAIGRLRRELPIRSPLPPKLVLLLYPLPPRRLVIKNFYLFNEMKHKGPLCFLEKYSSDVVLVYFAKLHHFDS
jgi:hypothetical protein